MTPAMSADTIALHDNSHPRLGGTDATSTKVGHGTVAPQRRPAAVYRVDDLAGADDVKVGIVLTSERSADGILHGRARAHRDGPGT
jgi:hypothetical protein